MHADIANQRTLGAACLLAMLAGILVVSGCERPSRDIPRAQSGPTAEDTAALAVRRLLTNTNQEPAGTMRGDTLDVALEVLAGGWYPEANDGMHETVLAFAERGKAGRIPGPLLRVSTGTTILASIHNPLKDTLFVHGFRALAATTGISAITDSTFRGSPIAPGATLAAIYETKLPGTFFYWASTDGSTIEKRRSIDSQLSGGIVVDSTNAKTNDRIFLISIWSVPPDSTGPKPWVPRDMMTINGKSWPHTERFHYSVGDTVRWRWINPSIDAHPMHLHGFYFDVTSHGTDLHDTIYSAADRRMAVTELMLPGTTMAMQFVPAVAGNWLFHCHFTFHVSHYLSFALIPDETDAGGPMPPDHKHEMHGLALGIVVRDTASKPATAAASATPVAPRQLRLVAARNPGRYGKNEGLIYLLGTANIARLPKLSSTINLNRGEPVSITVVNQLRQPTAVHWHGIELRDSYVDGVPQWSGNALKLAPAIAVSDSFVASFTPPRAGTFIYHSHSNEEHQIGFGLYGALIVRDTGSMRDTMPEHVFVIGSDGPNINRSLVNGEVTPKALVVEVGRTYRLRIVQMNPEMRVYVSLRQGDRVLNWKPVAKDGADLPHSQQQVRVGRVLMGPGETLDVEVAADSLKNVKFEVSTLTGGSKTSVPFVLRSVRNAVQKSH
ncbi:MAG: multicopper oxidase domain-containing protein [Gemmatimonadaceae bacterium]